MTSQPVKRKTMIYRTDYHMHTVYSDGRARPEEYLAAALGANLKEIGFSEHLTLHSEPASWSMDPGMLPAYTGHIKRLRESTREIKVKTGLEVDYFSGREDEIRTRLDGADLDYVLGSVHYLGNDSVDLGRDFYTDKDPDLIFSAYFDQVSAAIESDLFDIIAHFDLIRIYGLMKPEGKEDYYRKLAVKMKEHDVAFEVNTNGRNRPLADFYPDRRFLHIFREEGVPVCVNSDAHMPSRVAQYFDEAYDLLRDAGYTEMAVFSGRERQMVPFR